MTAILNLSVILAWLVVVWACLRPVRRSAVALVKNEARRRAVPEKRGLRLEI